MLQKKVTIIAVLCNLVIYEKKNNYPSLLLIGRFSFLKNLSGLCFQKLTETLFGSEMRLYD